MGLLIITIVSAVIAIVAAVIAVINERTMRKDAVHRAKQLEKTIALLDGRITSIEEQIDLLDVGSV